jgi:uncharacterized protein (TIGR03437 family)
LKRIIFAGLFCLIFGVGQQAFAQINLGQSTQNLTLTGLGPNSSGNGVSRVTYGNCVYDGTKTTCTLSGPFTGLGPGGTWVFTLTYPGNGPSPLDAITAPGSDLYTNSLSAGSLTYVFNESNGTSVSYNHGGGLLYVPSLTSCTGTPVSSCDTGTVGQTPGAIQSGPVTGTVNLAPIIQAVISASGYGGFSSIAPATWIEIYGQNLAATTTQWGGSDFQGNNAPTSVGGTMVTVGGQPAFVYYVSPIQVDVQVASNVAVGSQPVIVSTAAGASAPFNTNVNATEPRLLAPAAFKINNTQYALAQFSDGFYDLPPGTAGLAAKRAVPGDILILYGIGFGPVSDGTPAGIIDQGQNNLTNSFNVLIGGMAAEVKYAGLTPPYVGLYQFNVVVPNIPASDTTPLTFTLNGTPGTQTLNLFIGN